MYGDVLHAPLDPTKASRCLDIGCGTGYVTHAMAKKYPSAEVIGLDLSDLPFDSQWESNVRLFQGNIYDKPVDWKSSDGTTKFRENEKLFDLTWSRLVTAGVTDWTGLFQREFELLKPGGWAECHEPNVGWIDDQTGESLMETYSWTERVQASFDAVGLDQFAGSKAAERMENAGFVDVQVVPYRMPIGNQHEKNPFLKKAGDWLLKDLREVHPLLMKASLPRIGVGEAEIRDTIRLFEEALTKGDRKSLTMYVTFGRKPDR